MFFLVGLPRPRYALLGNLSISEKHFSPRIFLSLAFCFYRHRTIIPYRREGKQLFYTKRSEVKTVFLTGERVKHFFRGFFSGQAKIFSCDRILFFGKVASDQTIRSLASNWSLMDDPWSALMDAPFYRVLQVAQASFTIQDFAKQNFQL